MENIIWNHNTTLLAYILLIVFSLAILVMGLAIAWLVWKVKILNKVIGMKYLTHEHITERKDTMIQHLRELLMQTEGLSSNSWIRTNAIQCMDKKTRLDEVLNKLETSNTKLLQDVGRLERLNDTTEKLIEEHTKRLNLDNEQIEVLFSKLNTKTPTKKVAKKDHFVINLTKK